MQKWEYGCLELEEKREIDWMPRLREWGDNGWEMVAVVAHRNRDTFEIFFKKPVK